MCCGYKVAIFAEYLLVITCPRLFVLTKIDWQGIATPNPSFLWAMICELCILNWTFHIELNSQGTLFLHPRYADPPSLTAAMSCFSLWSTAAMKCLSLWQLFPSIFLNAIISNIRVAEEPNEAIYGQAVNAPRSKKAPLGILQIGINNRAAIA